MPAGVALGQTTKLPRAVMARLNGLMLEVAPVVVTARGMDARGITTNVIASPIMLPQSIVLPLRWISTITFGFRMNSFTVNRPSYIVWIVEFLMSSSTLIVVNVPSSLYRVPIGTVV